MDPFVAEIRMFACNFAPVGWALCNGQILPISQNTALFSLLGTTYGGNGTSNFGLPNLQNSVAVHAGTGAGLTPRNLGSIGGSATVTLQMNEMAAHTHQPAANSGDGILPKAIGNVWAGPGADRDVFAYHPTQTATTMNAAALTTTGGTQPHNNYMPYQTVIFCIALQGVFPARN